MFTLTVFPDGRCLLTTDDQVDADQAQRILDLFEQWRTSEKARVFFLSDTQVQHATSLEVDLGA